jgi:hypothetical protein
MAISLPPAPLLLTFRTPLLMPLFFAAFFAFSFFFFAGFSPIVFFRHFHISRFHSDFLRHWLGLCHS